ncbi:transposase family protein, partial [Actinokineospora diospyrosa]
MGVGSGSGSRHDSYCLRTSGILDEYDVTAWMGDKGYIGTAMLTPIRKPKHRDLLDWEKDFNYHHNKKRAIVEHAIANLTTWHILHTDHRRPIDTFATTISAVLGLQFYR